jgi:hypothetical protein
MLRCAALSTLIPALLAAQAAPRLDVVYETTPPAAISLRVPAGTVALALGNAGLVSTDADVLFYNPGMLTSARGMALSAQRYDGNGTAASMAATQMFGSIGVGIGARFADWSSAEGLFGDAVRGGLGVLGSAGTSRAASTALTVGAARVVGPVRIGVGATYVRESFRVEHDESSQFDVGVVMPMGPTSLALTVQHIGNPLGMSGLNPASSSGDFPGAAEWRATLGYGGWGFPLATFWDLGGTVQLSIDESGTVRSAGGGELTYVPVEGVSIAARIGSRSTIGNELPVTGGVGLSLDRYSLDYALESFRGGVRAHRVGLRIR